MLMFTMLKLKKIAFSSVLLSSLFISPTSDAEMISSAEKDVLTQISIAITQVDDRLKNHRLFVTPSKMDWPEMSKFQTDLMFVLAHDPHGPPSKNLPQELHPTFLSTKLKETWNKLEVSLMVIGELSKETAWISLKSDMDLFFQHRDNFMYQPARALVKSPEFKVKLDSMKAFVFDHLKAGQDNKDVTIKVMDPFIEKMGAELTQLNRSILQLKEFHTPKPIENPSIYQPKHLRELIVLAVSALAGGLFLAFTFVWLKSKFVKKKVDEKPIISAEAFNYYEWVKQLESCLQSVKDREDHSREDFIKLKEMADDLRDSRKKLNQADTQQEFYNALDELNATSAKLEEHFDKEARKKHVEASRKLISHMIKLCEAVEAKKEINLGTEKPRLKLVKSENHRVAG
jgi:uncharacterized protein YukE